MSEASNHKQARLLSVEKSRLVVEKRFNNLKKFCLGVVIIFAVSLIFGLIKKDYSTPFLILIVGAIGFYFLHYLYYDKKKSYIHTMKEIVGVDTLKQYFDGVEFTPTKGLLNTSINGTDLFDNKNSFESSDLITGNYQGVNFKCSDVKAKTKYHNSEGKAQTTTAFHGQLYIFDCINPDESYLLQRDKQFEVSERLNKGKFDRMGEKFMGDLLNGNMRSNFNDRFKHGVSELFSAKKYPSAIATRKNKVYFAVYSKKDMLEPSFKRESLDMYQEDLNDYAQNIINIIETLGLRERIS